MATLTVIYWRDIPAQVNATSGRASAKAQLDERFQQAIDAAAMKAGLVDAEAYLEQWRQVTRPCSEALQREVAAEAERLETEYTPEVLSALAETGGLRERIGAPGLIPLGEVWRPGHLARHVRPGSAGPRSFAAWRLRRGRCAPR